MSKNKLDVLTKDGIKLPEKTNFNADLALTSLRVALKAYFSTYKSVQHWLHVFQDASNDQETIDFYHTASYCEASAETIVHFQHFAELVIKGMLRTEHPLLADLPPKDDDKHLVLFKLVNGLPLDPSEEQGLMSIEFSEALKRLVALVKKNVLKKQNVAFVLAAEPMLARLNTLRNRIWHRGVFILRYQALDQFVGQYVLPFVKNVLALPEYSGNSSWKYCDLDCGIDPIEEIISSMSGGGYDIGKIALLKELGRAAYENPLIVRKSRKKKLVSMAAFLDREIIKKAERIATLEASGPVDVLKCPVCGTDALNLLYEYEDNYDEEGYEKGQRWRYTYEVICQCCSFNPKSGIENASKYGLPIEDFWISEEA